MARSLLPAGIVVLRVEDVRDLLVEATEVVQWAEGRDLEPSVQDCITTIRLRVVDWLEANGYDGIVTPEP